MLPRSSGVLPLPLFQKILGLYAKRPWLEAREAAVSELHSLCRSERELELVVDLLARFTFLTGTDLRDRCRQVAEQIVSGWKLAASDTILVAKHFESGRGDSSSVINVMMQPALSATHTQWTRDNFELSAIKAIENPKFKNIVLVDDFSGTGNSALKFLSWADSRIRSRNLSAKNIYLAFFCAMEQTGKCGLPASRLFVGGWLKRGISDFYDPGEVPSRIAEMIDIERTLEGLPKKYSLGFEKSESLYSTELLNIPNNNFPIFWWNRRHEGRQSVPLFDRIS